MKQGHKSNKIVSEKSCYFRQAVREGASERPYLKGDLNEEKDGGMKLSGERVQGSGTSATLSLNLLGRLKTARTTESERDSGSRGLIL